MANDIEKQVIEEFIAKKQAEEMDRKTIDVKRAAQNAELYLKSLVLNVSNIMLEEVELTDDEQFWLITLSYNDLSTGIQNMFGKTVKIFKVRRDNGEVISMKIRSI